MKELKEMIRTFVILIVRFFMHFFWIFPVSKKTVVFSCYKGTQYSCSPKYIFLELKKQFGDKIKYVWILNSKSEDKDLENVKIVKFMSLKYLFYICTCSVYINNVFFEPFIPKRKKQLFINTWHGGGAYKGNDDNRKNSKSMLLKDRVRDSITDYYISSCKAFTDCWVSEFSFENKKFLPIGLPRNDIFASELENIELIRKIKNKLNIDDNKKIIFFAPTWRFQSRETSKTFKFDFDVDELVSHVEKKFGGKYVFLFRGHHCMKDIMFNEKLSNNFIDASKYPDMQELLLITDLFISDYSSCIWDFALTKRPGFLYTPDLVEYTATQHLLTPIDTWQYEYACSFNELLNKIDTYDYELSKKKIDTHLDNLISYESGCASKHICSMIKEHQGIK